MLDIQIKNMACSSRLQQEQETGNWSPVIRQELVQANPKTIGRDAASSGEWRFLEESR